ncbi:MAG: 3'(2'),5'-bisphosphate nucleotidase [Anaerolineae bacterium]|nr:3'(2'),5'-bisphosphate nucleotidase [Anaerolineae bacterium]
MQFDFEQYLTYGIAAVKVASRLVQRIQREIIIDALNKSDNSPVTIADFASQAVVSRMLHTYLPATVIVGEENADEIRKPQHASTLAQIVQYVNLQYPEATPPEILDWIDAGNMSPGDRYWTLDPIDGTKGFLRGDQYVVALAFIENAKVQIGILGCPNLSPSGTTDGTSVGCIAFAVRGQGAWISPLDDSNGKKRLTVSSVNQTSKIRLLRSFESGHTDTGRTEDFLARLGTRIPAIAMDSQAKYVLLASGQGDLLLRMLSPNRMDYKEKIWDQAAGSIILEEAGGIITDIDGKPLDFTCGRMLLNNTGILATNGLVHQQALEALQGTI